MKVVQNILSILAVVMELALFAAGGVMLLFATNWPL